MKIKKRYFLGVFVFTFLIFSVFTFIKTHRITNALILPKKTDTYTDIFLKSKSDLIKSDLTYFSKNRLPVATFNYDEKFKIIISKFNISDKSKIDELVKINLGRSRLAFGITYNSILLLNQFNFELNTESKMQKCNQIDLAIFGDSITKTRINDDALDYYLTLDHLSIKLNGEKDPEIFVSKKQKAVPSEILFFKKQNNLFVVVMIPNTNDYEVKPKSLLNLFIHSNEN
ncbi:hypothetical protein ACUN24_13255 [Pedobacter sp. WC2501]|uniref:hypothetical protein n=1 Tax=Pedobacter sp. WC2501 TaxID=3461400 RepID=UPI0040456F2E